MPSPVPAGYTRGSILFLGAMHNAHAQERLLQRFWQEAGAYGARIIVLVCGGDLATGERYAALFRDWECDSARLIEVATRATAADENTSAAIQSATGVLLLGNSAMQVVGILGGTLLVQTIRRMNAQGKVFCAAGGGAAVICQHMIAFGSRDAGQHHSDQSTTQSAPSLPFVHRDNIQFAPGLGLVNRLVFDSTANTAGTMQPPLSRLLTAIAYNPFLSGFSLDRDTGAALYANGQLEIFGDGSALIIDGNTLQYTSLHEVTDRSPVSLLGVQMHLLTHGCTFNMDTHLTTAPSSQDISLQTAVIKSAY